MTLLADPAQVSTSPALAPEVAYAAARRVCRHHAKSFYFASPLLTKEKRLHAFAVYALCRRLDDAVDEAPSPEDALREVSAFGGTLDRVYGSEPILDVPVLEAARLTIAACEIPRGRFTELCMGVEADLTVTRYEDWPGLKRYCYLVAGVVGLMMCSVFDLRDFGARKNAIAMGDAMQLTNILRDVAEDLRRGRVYLPQAELRDYGLCDRDLVQFANGRTLTDGFRALMKFQVKRARALYAEGYAGLAALDRDGSRQTASLMATVYGGILDAIERADYDVFSARRHLTWFQKLRRVPTALRRAR